MAIINTNIFHRGKLRFVATFQNPTMTQDGAGGEIPTYNNVLTTRCQIFKEGGSEILGSGQIYYNENYTMRCGFRSALNINTDTIISIRGPGLPATIFKIVTWGLVDMIEHLYEFKLSVNKS